MLLLLYKHVSKAFEDIGLKRSKHDPCLWYGKDIILVQHVDNCGIGAPNQGVINDLIEKMRSKGFELTQESSFAKFLGIKFKHHNDGTIEMTQKGLIKKTLATAGMENCNPGNLPAPMDVLGSHKDDPPMEKSGTTTQ